jgi:translation initiation factor 3 subunit J
MADDWDNEDGSDAPDDWEASSSEDEKKPVAKPMPPSKKKAPMEKEKEEEEVNETPAQLKTRLRAEVEKSDLEAASTLFGGIPGKPMPRTRDEFLALGLSLSQQLTQHSTSPHFASVVDLMLRESVANLSVDETRKLSSTLTALLSEKQKAAKSATKGSKKKSTKITPVVGRGVDTTNYDEGRNYDDDDLDDFM